MLMKTASVRINSLHSTFYSNRKQRKGEGRKLINLQMLSHAERHSNSFILSIECDCI